MSLPLSLTVLKSASNVISVALQNLKSHKTVSFNRNSDTSCRIHKSFATQIEKMYHQLPIFACGEIVRGFGRGSKELGIPTANFSLDAVKTLPESLHTGVYYGWANVNNGEVYKMVLSVGWNPFYNNKEKSVETHMLHNFNCDLYGKTLKLCIVGFLRPEQNFESLDALILGIKLDIEKAITLLDTPDSKKLQTADYFSEE